MTDPVVTTPSGQVRGAATGGVLRFLGIPYAAAPVGELAFQPPQPPLPWTGERDGTRFGPTPPQAVRHQNIGGFDLTPLQGLGWVKGDDFLNLNVFSSDLAGRAPVMVFVPGGGFVAGSNTSPLYDGEALARRGVVVVVINHRLGLDGFAAMDGAATNIGLRDVIAALQWVQASIPAFGGDPGCVTLFGESSGAMITADLMASPLARGLFHRAIVQSGHGQMVRSIPIARRVARAVARMLRTTADAAGLRAIPIEARIAAQDKVGKPGKGPKLKEADGRDPVFGMSKFTPVHGDDVLPIPPIQALAQGAGREIDLLIGADSDEMQLAFAPAGLDLKLNALLAWFVLKAADPRAGAILRAYRRKGEKPGRRLSRAIGDLAFRLPIRRFAAAHQGRSHVYEFDWKSPALDGRLGACHGLELPFVFGTLDAVPALTGATPPRDLAERIQALWVGFARDGVAPWPAYRKLGDEVLYLHSGELADPPIVGAAFG